MSHPPRKLTQAVGLLLNLLSGARSMPVASCVAIAAEHDLNPRTVFAVEPARHRRPGRRLHRQARY